jgi:hypothetical protein
VAGEEFRVHVPPFESIHRFAVSETGVFVGPNGPGDHQPAPAAAVATPIVTATPAAALFHVPGLKADPLAIREP